MDPFASATEMLRALRRREVGALELLEAQLARIERCNGTLNAIVCTDLERARDTARALDSVAASQLPLRGLPMMVKESFDVAGAPTTWGMPALEDNVARTDSVVVERLHAAGAVVFGKTNVPFALADLQTYNEIYGNTGNPWDPSRTPGGSSVGVAAALASGLVPLEVGSDIGGSIRNPAHCRADGARRAGPPDRRAAGRIGLGRSRHDRRGRSARGGRLRVPPAFRLRLSASSCEARVRSEPKASGVTRRPRAPRGRRSPPQAAGSAGCRSSRSRSRV